MLRKPLFAIVFLTVVLMMHSPIYAYWQQGDMLTEVSQLNNNFVAVGIFSSDFCYRPNDHTIIINEHFKEKYMQQVNQNDYDWKRDRYDNIINRDEIKALTPQNTIIYVGTTPFLVITYNYNLIDHGIPSLQNPLGWALCPLVLNHVYGWTYRQNHVVLAQDNVFYMAKHYTTTNPTQHRSDWSKIEPVEIENFAQLENSNLPDYRNPILTTINRSYLYDNYTAYLVGDAVFYNNQEWIAVSASTNIPPSAANSWAWIINV